MGSPAGLSALTISGYASQPSTLGRLNDLIGTCYSGSGYMGTGMPFDVSPPIYNSELAIIEGMIRANWYMQLATTMMGTSQTDIPWTNLREGDSQIGRANGWSLGKEYREMARQTIEQMNYLANAWSINRSYARSVDYLNPGYPGIANPYGVNGGIYWRQ